VSTIEMRCTAVQALGIHHHPGSWYLPHKSHRVGDDENDCCLMACSIDLVNYGITNVLLAALVGGSQFQ
jgi:hypothetical protein